jgi:hypothetical protein
MSSRRSPETTQAPYEGAKRKSLAQLAACQTRSPQAAL